MQEDNSISQKQNNTQNGKEAMEECQKKAQEYLNNWKRERADFLNYKKDESERISSMIDYCRRDFILKVLPVLDNVYLAQKHSDVQLADGMSDWLNGLLQIQKQFEEFLKKEGVEKIETLGVEFNAETMETVGEVEGGEPGKVVEEVQAGYAMDGRVLRPAKVKISK